MNMGVLGLSGPRQRLLSVVVGLTDLPRQSALCLKSETNIQIILRILSDEASRMIWTVPSGTIDSASSDDKGVGLSRSTLSDKTCLPEYCLTGLKCQNSS